MSGPFHRPDLYLLARLLERIAAANPRLKRTQLQVASGINYTQLERYLEFMQAHGLVVMTEDPGEGGRLTITPRGFEALTFLSKAIRDLLQEEFQRKGTLD